MRHAGASQSGGTSMSRSTRGTSRQLIKALVGCVVAVGLLVPGAAAHAGWSQLYSNSKAKQETWYGPSLAGSITGTRTSVSGWIPGKNAITWARTGTGTSAFIGSSSGLVTQVDHPARSARSTGKWRFVIDPTDPGTITLDVYRNGTGTGPMRIAGTSSDDLHVLDTLPTSRDTRLAGEADGLSETVDLDSLRVLGKVGSATYAAGSSLDGGVALVAVVPGGVSAVAVATPEQFAAQGLGISVSTPAVDAAPVYLIPDFAAAGDRGSVEKVGTNLIAEAPQEQNGRAAGTFISLGDEFALLRVPDAGLE